MRGQHDLDVRGQNSATAEAIRRFVHHITRAIAAAAAFDSALCEQSWLRLRPTAHT